MQSSSADEMAIVELIVKPNHDTESLLEQIPFYRFPKILLNRLEKGERPSPAERREAVRIIVAGVMEHIHSPMIRHLEAVAMEIVRRYPESFKDTIGKESVGLGHESLLCQLINRTENSRRTSGALKRKISENHSAMPPKRLADS